MKKTLTVQLLSLALLLGSAAAFSFGRVAEDLVAADPAPVAQEQVLVASVAAMCSLPEDEAPAPAPVHRNAFAAARCTE